MVSLDEIVRRSRIFLLLPLVSIRLTVIYSFPAFNV